MKNKLMGNEVGVQMLELFETWSGTGRAKKQDTPPRRRSTPLKANQIEADEASGAITPPSTSNPRTCFRVKRDHHCTMNCLSHCFGSRADCVGEQVCLASTAS